MKLLAHLTQIDGQRIEQSLKDHCFNTAEYASESLQHIGFYHTAYLSGLIHDMGKATAQYNNYLEASFCGEKVVKGSIIHTFTPVVCLMEHYHRHYDKSKSMVLLTSEIIAYAVGSHHGLFDCVNFDGKNGFYYRMQKDRDEIAYDEAGHNYFENVICEQELDELFQKTVQEITGLYQSLIQRERTKQKVFFQLGLFTRLLTSAVIYGDRRDTCEFMEQRNVLGEQKAEWKEQLDYLEDKIAEFNAESELNKVRSDISRQCLEFAKRPTGIYRLNVPTGGGKTLSALRYALAHAKEYSKKKIIFIIPLLSVLDQNAKVIRSYLKDERLILEHHSNVVHEKTGEDLDRYEILTENWDSPVIISTLVQFLNILFDQKTSAVGRMRALCDSVIVIDEVQSVPKKTIEMFSAALNFLNHYCNATIILSSATQPCFENLEYALKISEPADLVQLSGSQKKVFQRAEIINCVTPYGMDLNACAEFCSEKMEQQHSLLMICNTKTEARIMFAKMKEIADANGWVAYHLSTAMCQQHRLNVLKELQNKLEILQEALKKNEPVQKVICISTQMVEAGVDFSFETVVRVLAGVDNLAQAAGRCNRSNEYPDKGTVYLINLKDENLSMLEEIYEAQQSTLRVLKEKVWNADRSIIDEAAAYKFYQYFFAEMKNKMKYPIKEYGSPLYMADLLGFSNPYVDKNAEFQTFLRQPFKTLAERFEVFKEDTIDILVPYQEGRTIIEELKELQAEKKSFKMDRLNDLVKRAKRYTISIYQYQKDKLDDYGWLEGLFEDRILILNEKAYSEDYGLDMLIAPTVSDFMF
jgi:CRISPR-associated endonuclease/helicase Cas3